ncbi:MAG TPA: hypothetical protein VGO53_00880, partial [Steroidobacteraceae bacterium]|nr:hypothetical protein [Steroidobacteraceae bacterium]
MIRKLLKSPALRVAAAFGVAGVAFTVANLIFARVLSATDYGLLSLFMAIVVVSGPAAPLGLDLVITRRGLRLGWNLRRATLAASTFVALVTVAISLALYDLSLPLLACVLIATIAGGATQTSSAHFQSARRFALAVPIMQAQNWVLI